MSRAVVLAGLLVALHSVPAFADQTDDLQGAAAAAGVDPTDLLAPEGQLAALLLRHQRGLPSSPD